MLLIISLAIILLVYLSFRIIAQPLKIREAIGCNLIHDMKEGKIFSYYPSIDRMLNYDFLWLAIDAFGHLINKKPEYKKILKEAPFNLEGKVIQDFIIYAILRWLKFLPFTIVRLTFRKAPRSPRIYFDKTEKMRDIHLNEFSKEIMDNVFIDVPELGNSVLPIRLPRNMELTVKTDSVILENRNIKIKVTFFPSGWFRGVDRRLFTFLQLSEKENQTLGTALFGIMFEAELKPMAILFSDTGKYWNYSKDMFEHLKTNYSWSACLDDLKESLLWGLLLET